MARRGPGQAEPFRVLQQSRVDLRERGFDLGSQSVNRRQLLLGARGPR